MPYGTIKIDTITFTSGSSDVSIPVSGLVQNPTFTGNVTVTGTVTAPNIIGTTLVSGVTVTGTTANFTSGNFSNISGGTHTITSGVFAAGTAANPSISFTSDPNTGIYSPGADQVAISTNGSGRLFVDASGNIGIGVTPSTWNSSTKSFEISTVGGVVGDAFTTKLATNCFYNTSGNWIYRTSAGASRYEVERGAHTWYNAASGTAGNTITFTQAMTLDSSGRLGLGTSSPGELLDVAGIIRQTGNTAGTANSVGLIDFYNANNTTTIARINVRTDGAANSGSYRISTANAGTLNEVIRIDSSGRVGIGTTSPATPLHVAGNVTVSSGSGIYLGFGSEQYITSSGASTNNTSLVFQRWTGAAYGESARFDNSGRLLVGTSTYSGNSAFVIKGGAAQNVGLVDVRFGGSRPTTADVQVSEIRFGSTDFTSNSAYANIQCITDGASSSDADIPGRLVFSTTADGASSPTERMRIGQAGYLKVSNNGTYVDAAATHHDLVNTASNHTQVQRNTNASPLGLRIDYTSDPNSTAAQFLYLSGGATLRAEIRSNGGLANYSANNVNLSDRNVKKDISPAAGAWDCLKEWEIVNYRYKDQPDDADLNMGVIAQQVAESCPEVITVFQEAKEAKEAVLDEEGNELEPAQEAQPEKLGVKDQQMMWMAIKALQEAMERIEALEAEVAALKAS